MATFVYDGDGKQVQAVVNGVTSVYVGGHYQIDNGVVTKYYFAGMQRIAMRKNGALSYLLSDHLGSTSLTTNSSGVLVSELRYKPWGETRNPTGTTPTNYQFTGQRNEVSIGLYFYNARWYDSTTGRFAQADSIVPGGVQGLDRYAYVNNSPINYVDPSGHKACDEREGCINSKTQAKCSAGEGYFNGSFKCTPEDLNKVGIAQRKNWFLEMLASVDSDLVEEFNAITGILNTFTATNTGAPGTWSSWGDAGILNSIQNGLAKFSQEKYIPGSSPFSTIATNAWNNYFTSFATTGHSNESLRLWGAAEGASTSYGRVLSQEHGTTKSPGEMLFLLIGDVYRDTLSVRQDPATMTPWPGVLYDWVFDPSTTIEIPFTNGGWIAPVSLPAYFLLTLGK